MTIQATVHHLLITPKNKNITFRFVIIQIALRTFKGDLYLYFTRNIDFGMIVIFDLKSDDCGTSSNKPKKMKNENGSTNHARGQPMNVMESESCHNLNRSWNIMVSLIEIKYVDRSHNVGILLHVEQSTHFKVWNLNILVFLDSYLNDISKKSLKYISLTDKMLKLHGIYVSITNASYETNFCYWSYQGAYLLLLPAIHQRRIMVTGRVSISSSSTSMVKTTHRHFNGDFGDQNLGSWWLWGNHQLGSGNLEHTECKRSEVQKNFTLILSSHALAVLKIYPYLCAPNSVR